MRRSEVYWRERALLREQQAAARAGVLSAKLMEEYQQALAEIRREVSHWYTRYASEQGLTYEQAVRILNRGEMQEWKGTIGRYVNRFNRETDPKIKARLKAELDALSYNSRITRLQALEGQIELILNDTYARGVEQLKAEFGDAFEEGYFKKCYDLQSRAGFIHEVAKIDPATIEDVVSYPWSGAGFSDRLWRNKQALAFSMRETLTQGLIQGRSVAAMSRQLSGHTGQSYRAAERVVRTELNHIHNESDKAAYHAAGIKEYEYMATLDARTCDVCGALDGKHFPLDKAEAGVNFPPMHPNDRCTTVEYDPDDAMDWYNSGVEMPHRMTYEEWTRQQGIAKDGDSGHNVRKSGEPRKRIPELPASDISAKIASGQYSATLSHQQYLKHVEGTPQFAAYQSARLSRGESPQSTIVLSKAEVQELIRQKAGTGIIRVDRKGNPRSVEAVTADQIVGSYFDRKLGIYVETKKAAIHYAKKSAHLVPIKGDDYD